MTRYNLPAGCLRYREHKKRRTRWDSSLCNFPPYRTTATHDIVLLWLAQNPPVSYLIHRMPKSGQIHWGGGPRNFPLYPTIKGHDYDSLLEVGYNHNPLAGHPRYCMPLTYRTQRAGVGQYSFPLYPTITRRGYDHQLYFRIRYQLGYHWIWRRHLFHRILLELGQYNSLLCLTIIKHDFPHSYPNQSVDHRIYLLHETEENHWGAR